MSLSELQLAPVSVETLESWNRERSTDELYTLLGRRMGAVALDTVSDEESSYEDAQLFDLATL